MKKYFLKADILGIESEWKEITLEEFIKAEKRAGFRSIYHDYGENATAAFTGNNIKGKIKYG